MELMVYETTVVIAYLLCRNRIVDLDDSPPC